MSKGESSDKAWFTLNQGGLLTNGPANGANVPSWGSITVDFTQTSDFGYLMVRGSNFEITSPENGALPLASGQKTSFSEDGLGYPYFSVYAPVGSFLITSVTLYGSEPAPVFNPSFLDVYSINDTHGAIPFDDTAGKNQSGISRLSSFAMAQQRANPDSTVFLSSGDMWQGGFMSILSRGVAMVDWMNVAGFESMAIGNHEFDWGDKCIASNSDEANFPFLGINILDSQGQRPSWAKPSLVVHRGPYKIGVVGAIGPALSNSIAVSSLGGYHFDSNYATLIETEAERLKKEEGCDLVFLSLHDGSYLTKSGTALDAVLEGHTHLNYEKTDGNGIPHIQAGANGEGFQKLRFQKNALGKWAFSEFENDGFSVVSARPVETITEDIIAHFNALYPDKVVGQAATDLSKAQIASIATEAMFDYYDNASWSATLAGALINAGGVRQTIAAGEVLYSEVMNALPFTNDNVLCTVTGASLKELLKDGYLVVYSPLKAVDIVDGNSYSVIGLNYVTEKSEYASKMTEVRRDRDKKLYEIVADYFLINGVNA